MLGLNGQTFSSRTGKTSCLPNGNIMSRQGTKIIKFLDGGLEITFRVAGLDEIKRWILTLDPEGRKSSRIWFGRIYPRIWLNIQKALS